MSGVEVDGGDEFTDAGETAPSDDLVGELPLKRFSSRLRIASNQISKTPPQRALRFQPPMNGRAKRLGAWIPLFPATSFSATQFARSR